jgi:thioredoxin reductase (NADPH)
MYDIVIIGGGPAGASAAIFTGRAGLQTLVIDADKGFTRRAMVNNHLGFPDGITGPELVDRGRQHAVNAGAEWIESNATSLAADGDHLVIRTEDRHEYEARDVLLTQGINMTLAKESGIDTVPGTEPRIQTVIAVDADGETNKPGVWAAGTAAGVSVHTIVTAGDGARVAINIISRQRNDRHVDHDILASPTQ